MDFGFQLDPGETIQRIIHRHIFDLLPSVLASFALVAVSALIAFVMGRFPDRIPFPPTIALLLAVLLLVIAAIILLIGVFIFRRNVLIFTNVHLVQVEQLALFQRRVSQLSFLRVEDVTGRRVGFLETVFNYGEFQVQSAGEQEKFIFRNAPDPERLADDALAIHEECARRIGHAEPETI